MAFDREPKEPEGDPRDLARRYSLMLQQQAEDAYNIAASKRKLYLAYISEGFTEAQAIDLLR